MKIDEELEALRCFKKRVLFSGLKKLNAENKFLTCSCYLRGSTQEKGKFFTKSPGQIRISKNGDDFTKHEGCPPGYYIMVPDNLALRSIEGTDCYTLELNNGFYLEAFINDDY